MSTFAPGTNWETINQVNQQLGYGPSTPPNDGGQPSSNVGPGFAWTPELLAKLSASNAATGSAKAKMNPSTPWYADPNSPQYKWARSIGLASDAQIKKIANGLNSPTTSAAEADKYKKIISGWDDQYANTADKSAPASKKSTANNSQLWSGYDPKDIQRHNLQEVLDNNPTLFNRGDRNFDPENGWNATGGGKDWATILGDDPQKYFNDLNVSQTFRYDPATGMVDVYKDPKIEAENKAFGGWGTDWIGPAGLIAAGAGPMLGAWGMAGGAGQALGTGLGGANAVAGGAMDMGVGTQGWMDALGTAAEAGGASWGVNPATSMIDNASGAFDFPVDKNLFPEALKELAPLGPPTNLQDAITKLDSTPAGKKLLNSMIGGASDAAGATSLVSKILGGTATAADLASTAGKFLTSGLAPILAAGVLEKNDNPLTGNVTAASNKALESAGAFGNMAPVGMQPSWQKAIELANSSAGAWKPYVDKAATYTSEAAGGIPSVNLSQYMNPFIDSVLTPQLRNINQAADKERMRLAHLAKISGNDTYATPGSTSSTRYGVEEGTLNDGRFKAIGDATGLAYKGAFDTATGLATTDLNRKMTAGGAFNTMANTVGTQGGADITRLAGAGDLEAKPQENKLTHAADTTKLYTSVIPGTTSAITATNKPSILGQAVGAFGVANAANKAGWFD